MDLIRGPLNSYDKRDANVMSCSVRIKKKGL